MMDEIIVATKFAAICTAGGLFFTAGMWIWCTLMKWSPVDITTQVYNVKNINEEQA